MPHYNFEIFKNALRNSYTRLCLLVLLDQLILKVEGHPKNILEFKYYVENKFRELFAKYLLYFRCALTNLIYIIYIVKYYNF